MVVGMSPMQLELVEMNHRYDQLGERLADRQQELKATQGEVKVIADDLQQTLAWLKQQERAIPSLTATMPQTQDEAAAKVKERQVRGMLLVVSGTRHWSVKGILQSVRGSQY